jgi:hypothetical protein
MDSAFFLCQEIFTKTLFSSENHVIYGQMAVQAKQGLSQLDKKIIGILLTAVLAIVFTASLSYFLFGQPNQTPNIPSPTPTPTPTLSPTPTTTPALTPAPTSELPYTYVVYEWYLNASQANSVDWLTQATYGEYDASKSWTTNYFDYLASLHTAPTQDAPWMLYVYLYVTAEYNASTGWTKATYEYMEYNDEVCYYNIEYVLTDRWKIADWSKTFT